MVGIVINFFYNVEMQTNNFNFDFLFEISTSTFGKFIARSRRLHPFYLFVISGVFKQVCNLFKPKLLSEVMRLYKENIQSYRYVEQNNLRTKIFGRETKQRKKNLFVIYSFFENLDQVHYTFRQTLEMVYMHLFSMPLFLPFFFNQPPNSWWKGKSNFRSKFHLMQLLQVLPMVTYK